MPVTVTYVNWDSNEKTDETIDVSGQDAGNPAKCGSADVPAADFPADTSLDVLVYADVSLASEGFTCAVPPEDLAPTAIDGKPITQVTFQQNQDGTHSCHSDRVDGPAV